MGFIQLSNEKENKRLQESNGKIFLDYIKIANGNMPDDFKIESFEPKKLVLCSHKRNEPTYQTDTITISKKKVTVVEEVTTCKSSSRKYGSTYYTKRWSSVTEFELINDSLTITKGEAFQSCREDDCGGADTLISLITSIEDIKSSSIEIFGHSRSEITKTEYYATGIEDLSKGINHIQLRPKENAVQKKLN